jgi:hypothetical protein
MNVTMVFVSVRIIGRLLFPHFVWLQAHRTDGFVLDTENRTSIINVGYFVSVETELKRKSCGVSVRLATCDRLSLYNSACIIENGWIGVLSEYTALM